MIRVMICDDIEEICTFFKKAISQTSDMEVVAVANSGIDAVKMADEVKPDVVLMDIQMETRTAGIDAAKKIFENNPETKIIMLTVHEEAELIVHSYLAGAVDYINKLSKPDYITEQIRKIYSEEILIGSTIALHIRDEFIKTQKIQKSLLFFMTQWSTLTDSEIDIIRLLVDGKSRREIADEKSVVLATVKTHINNILRKFECSSTKELLTNLKDMGIIEYLLKTKEKKQN